MMSREIHINNISSDIVEHADWSATTPNQQHSVRYGSGSSQTSQNSGDICRICHCESDPENPLLTPCYCSGSLKYVHQTCLQQWLTASETNACELCKFPFIMHTKIKPFNQWRSLDISGIERRRLCCSVLFHCAGAFCVIWSVCALIERVADDVKSGLIDWLFWTKLAVVSVGLTGGIVFMYIQCKAYLHLCHRWKARNRILLIQNAPEKVPTYSQVSPRTQKRGSGGHYAAPTQVHGTHATTPDMDTYSEDNEEQVRLDSCSSSYAPVAAMAETGSVRTHLKQQHSVFHHYGVDWHHHQSHHHHKQQFTNFQIPTGQLPVSANIEYERDCCLDDVVSHISSFRPYPQGSGSMTPFHDSINNVLEHSEVSSQVSVNDLCADSRQDLSAEGLSTDTGREHILQLSSFSGSGDHKAPSISSGVSHAVANGLGGFVYKPQSKRYSNSSIFVENRDILNDSICMDLDLDGSAPTYVKHKYRHFSIPTPPGIASENVAIQNPCIDRDFRRYSDTKLLDGLRISNESVSGNDVGDLMTQQQQQQQQQQKQLEKLLIQQQQQQQNQQQYTTFPVSDRRPKKHNFTDTGNIDPLDQQNSPSVRTCFKSLPNLNGGFQKPNK